MKQSMSKYKLLAILLLAALVAELYNLSKRGYDLYYSRWGKLRMKRG